MTEKLTVQYFANNDFAKESVQASEDPVGYDCMRRNLKRYFISTFVFWFNN